MGQRIVNAINCSLLLIFLSCQASEKEGLHGDAPQKTFDEAQAVVSLSGEALLPNALPESEASKRDSLLKVAKQAFDKEPYEEDNIIWYGRRLAYLSRFYAAINVYSRGLDVFPDSYRLLRHRGHRFISVRRFDLAAGDLKKAAKLVEDQPLKTEPDGLPNRLNKPLSNTHFNIWYHLGLAYYLQEDYNNARVSYETCLKYADNDDLLCATADWLYMTYRYLGETQKASRLLKIIDPGMRLVENEAYFKRLMMYKGLLSPDSLLSPVPGEKDPDLTMATQGYAVGNWYLMNGDHDKALEIFQQVVEGKSWSAFGYIAAEATLSGSRH